MGIIQSRGLGDILIALPIALHYYRTGHEIFWPICMEFWDSVKDHAPWVHWIPIPTDANGDFFYIEPMKRIKALGCKTHVVLYQSLNTSPELSDVPYFQIQHFDEFKYSKAEVPFLDKWKLDECITRFTQREVELREKLGITDSSPYYVTHVEGSNTQYEPDLSHMPAEWTRIDITEGMAKSVFDWITVIEGAEALICIDSVIANMVDQLKLSVDKYWIPRSHIHLTPVLGTHWTILDPIPGSSAAQRIFGSSK